MSESTGTVVACVNITVVYKLTNGQIPSAGVSTGGGAKSEYWLSIKSEIIGCRFTAASCEEPACKGAAMLCRSY